MTALSAALACCPAASVLTRVAMFSAICVSTGRSCKAVLIHCALHPVAASAIASARVSMVFDLKFIELLLVFEDRKFRSVKVARFQHWQGVGRRWSLNFEALKREPFQ